ncbi:MAG: CRISPR-associated helicase Cas3' [Gammaproteobacteria bacterium]
MTKYYAHSANDSGNKHLLKDHLSSVAALAKAALGNWRGAEEAGLAGLLHDLGKYGGKFQDRLNGIGGGLDHWSLGAYLAVKKGCCAAALAIQGHHIGLQGFQKADLAKLKPQLLFDRHPLGLTLSEADADLLENRLKADGLSGDKPQTRLFAGPLSESQARVDNMLDVRRLFSALVDADFIDTEAHFNGDEHGKIPRKPGLKLNENGLAESALAVLAAHIEALNSQNTKTSETLLDVRQKLLQTCLEKGRLPTGAFTLTAPTGSGKTLSMLAFALQHAVANKIERIILVVPYLSIIEQTAAIYRTVFKDFDDDFVLEHHSMAGLGAENVQSDAEGDDERQQQIKRQRLLSENWDAPIVITTSVQFLESLFSNRPSACRKIHRIANAVVLFDEVQTLPNRLIVPTLAALSHIAAQWRSSVVFATATQPAFAHLHEAVGKHCLGGWQPPEIVADHVKMTEALRRTRFEWIEETLTWESLADRINAHSQALCIVNLKRHAQELWQALQNSDGLFHLSTNMCPLHRQSLLREVRQRLIDGLPCRLVATQCIEAGVDVDFPVVYRAFAPLDAMIQAAGRCNREGKRERGQTYIFTPDCGGWLYPDSAYQQAANVAASLKNELGERFDPYVSEVIERYYRRLYTVADPEQAAEKLQEAIRDLSFPEVAREYRLIKNDMINIVVPYDEERFENLKHQAKQHGLTARWIKLARGLSISLFRPKADDVVWDSLLPVQAFKQGRYQRQEDWFIMANEQDYDKMLGYQKPESLNCWIG